VTIRADLSLSGSGLLWLQRMWSLLIWVHGANVFTAVVDESDVFLTREGRKRDERGTWRWDVECRV
jgi:hypothetical protein